MNSTLYRPLTEKEIATLTVYGCSAENWKQITVHPDFNPSFCSGVHFAGNVQIGKLEKVFELEGGVKKHAGIYNAVISNCIIGNDVYINKINNYLANFEIGNEAFIENINKMVTVPGSTFGNGTMVAVLIESGQRSIPIFEHLSAPMAYLMTFYRHRPEFIAALLKSAEAYTASRKADLGYIGNQSTITNCDTIRNLRAGDNCKIEGAILIQNGTIVSNAFAPVYIGQGVQCEDFIIQSGSKITGGSILSKCFIGQSCLIDKQFTVVDCVFFANCQGFHGEAISVFGGPYTVSHHKSTLLLAAYYSFMNAGSGSNFSNHMYKLGPVHQGITERGVKTSSNSYIMWPARIGAFTVVLGSHKGNPDISLLPFSYLIENEGESLIMPGINLHSAGTRRDVKKWKDRDGRKDPVLMDPFMTEMLTPYTICKILKGKQVLTELYQNMPPDAMFVWYQNCKIKKSSVRKGIELYQMAIDLYLGDKTEKDTEIKNIDTKITDWVDLAGLVAPREIVEQLMDKIEKNSLSIDEIHLEILNIFNYFKDYENSWIRNQFAKELKKPEEIAEKGRKAEELLNEMVQRDAKKEFNSSAKTGFGIDGDETTRDADFLNVRGQL